MNFIKFVKNSYLRTVCLCIVFTTSVLCSVYSAKYGQWQTVKVDDLASFDLPCSMEVQSEVYREMVRKLSNGQINVPMVRHGSIVCQQKGLNLIGTPNCNTKQYSRVVFNTIVTDGVFPKMGEKIVFSSGDFLEIEQILLTKIMNDERYGNRIFDISPMRIVKRDFGECLLIEYKRQLKNKPEVQVYSYYIFDNDKMFELTISYRISEFNIWCAPGNDIRNVINTLTLY